MTRQDQRTRHLALGCGTIVAVVGISAVISCFNSARYLPGCVDAIRAQQPPVRQVIVVDDHSADRTAQLAAELGCEVVRHDRIRGLATTRNSGLAAAEHGLIAFIDADVSVATDWLAVLLPVLQRPGVVMAGGRLIERHQQAPPDRWRATLMTQDHGTAPRSLAAEQPGRLSGFATLADRATLLAVGGYDTRYGRSYEDVDLSHRLIARGHMLAYEPGAVAYHERTDTTRSLMSSCWSWDHWPEYTTGTYHSALRLAAKLTKNVWRSARMAAMHMAAGDRPLIPVDMAMVWYHSWWDTRYYLAHCGWLPVRLRPRDADLGNLGR